MGEKKIIVLLSGEIAAGKTSLASKLERKFEFKLLKTRTALKELAKRKLGNTEPDRTFLQKFGKTLDDKDNGRWVLDYFQNDFVYKETDHFFVVDSVRIFKQIEHFRKAYSFSVYHIHLAAGSEDLRNRFLQRAEISGLHLRSANEKYDNAKNDITEKQVKSLAQLADICIDTSLTSEEDVFIRIASYLKLFAPTKNELVDVIIGGQFGSEGKGQIAAHISPEYDCLVRVGGPNAGHSVYEEPKKHVFHLIPSGSYRNQTAKIILGPGAVINLDKILEEIATYRIADELGNRLVIDENAIIISSKDIQIEEERQKAIGSTAQGVGAATANNLIARLNADDKHKAKHFKELKPFLGSSFDTLEYMYQNNKRVLLEGTQGTGLSLYHGIYPYVTSRDTTVSGCLSEAGISPKRVNKIIMVTRTYPIRVGGTSGDFISKEINWETVAIRSGKNSEELKLNEKTTTTKRDRRVAEFSWTMFKKACELNSPSDIALTFVDYISIANERVRRYDLLTSETKQFIEEIESCAGVKVSLISTCFDYRAIIDRRNW